jgi:hypothetical protein
MAGPGNERPADITAPPALRNTNGKKIRRRSPLTRRCVTVVWLVQVTTPPGWIVTWLGCNPCSVIRIVATVGIGGVRVINGSMAAALDGVSGSAVAANVAGKTNSSAAHANRHKTRMRAFMAGPPRIGHEIISYVKAARRPMKR